MTGQKKVPSRPLVPPRVPRKQKGNGGGRKNSLGIDRVKIRLAVFAVLLLAMFFALFSRLWFLQVLASDDYRALARENRVRKVHSEPPRGRILDRNGVVLVDNRPSRAVTIDKQVLDEEKTPSVLRRLSKLLDVKYKELEENLNDGTVSPYKPVPVANDVSEEAATHILVHQDRFPGVGIDELQIRSYPQGGIAAQILGYTGEISQEELDGEFVRGARPRYQPGDLVGKSGLERTYDRYLRGTPSVKKVVVNSLDQVVGDRELRDEQPGGDLVTSLDARIQNLAEHALESGILAARSRYQAPAGAAVVMDPRTGEVIALASLPTYNPSVLADGITQKEWDSLGNSTVNNPDDDAFLNRAIQAQRQPGSTFKVLTAEAALALGVADPYTFLPCPGSLEFGLNNQVFNNWTSADFGSIGFEQSLEISCDTFYYQLGWDMEELWGAGNGDGTEKFQKYLRFAGFGRLTGIDLPYEADGRVPDDEWCNAMRAATENTQFPVCTEGWLPGYSVNMAIGQGDLIVTPLQMAVAYATVANGGQIFQPRIGVAIGEDTTIDEGPGELQATPTPSPSPTGIGFAPSPTPTTTPSPTPTDEEDADPTALREGSERESGERIVKRFKPKVLRTLPLDDTELGVIRGGLEGVIAGASGTAAGAFAGFPLDQFPLAGKTGTAELGNTELQDAWFVSYGPTTDPRYVIAVYVEKAGHGGETAAPIARQIWEGIAALEGVGGLDVSTDEVSLGQDASG